MIEEFPWIATAKDHKYIIQACSYWHAARLVRVSSSRPIEYFAPISHLLAHASELALKHFLKEKLTSTQYHKLTGKDEHNLAKFLKKAVIEGLNLDILEALTVLQYARPHKKHYFRYLDKDIGMFPDPSVAEGRVAHLIDRCAGALGPLRGGRSPAAPIFVFDAPPTIQAPATPLLLEEIEQQIISKDEQILRERGLIE